MQGFCAFTNTHIQECDSVNYEDKNIDSDQNAAAGSIYFAIC